MFPLFAVKIKEFKPVREVEGHPDRVFMEVRRVDGFNPTGSDGCWISCVNGSMASLLVDAMRTLRDFWSKRGENILIIGISMIVVLGLFLLGAYLMTRYY